ncbi:hypothetical protein V5O48_011964 [Marasmius crinis-equi]|uniref:Uncharacterized protein n=1 Tax=Marasmius crinis-equi TaxID=585013 RepID=A0ABR3F431_9AGAR
MSERSLRPVECSPGIVFVRPQHIIPHLITDIGHAVAIAELCYPYSYGVEGQEVSLLRLARQPSPSLLPLLEPVLPNILSYKGRLSKERMVLEFVQWLKPLLPDPAYQPKTVFFMEQIRDWTICARSEPGELYELAPYEQICKVLDEAGFGNVRRT